MHPQYSDWLLAAVPTHATWRTKLTELNRIEKIYGDLDALFDEDGFEGLMGELAYSRVDQRNGEPNPSAIPIDGDLYNNLSSYRSALRKYQLFREEHDTLPPDTILRHGERPETRDAADLAFRYEDDLQTALIACIGQIEPGMTLAENGKEYTVPSGRIDALATDASGAPVVIELKAVTARREVLGQIAAYMADIQDETGQRPRGILIAPDFDAKLISGARMISGLVLKRYAFTFSFSDL